MSLSEFAAVATVGQSVSFVYHGKRRTGEIVNAVILPNGGKPFGNITIEFNDWVRPYKCFSIRKMSEIWMLSPEEADILGGRDW